jgi:hypothetical protein
MANKKDLIIAVLCTFCLATTLFTVIPRISSTGTYDPWLDINDDGKIDMKDIAFVARAFSSHGTPLNKTSLKIYLNTNVTFANQEASDPPYIYKFNITARNVQNVTLYNVTIRSVTTDTYYCYSFNLTLSQTPGHIEIYQVASSLSPNEQSTPVYCYYCGNPMGTSLETFPCVDSYGFLGPQ